MTPAEPKRILVVEDDRDAQEFIFLTLADTGYVIDRASNGQEALEKIEASRPDLVILDLMMPVLDGWGVLDRLRKIPDPPAVVILSAFPDEWKAFRKGAWESLAKPFKPSELVETCRRALAVT